MNEETFYRFECDGLGIYEAVARDCPEGDLRRQHKPDGSWLTKVGADFPQAISFWTRQGFLKYQSSMLRNWHLSVVNGPIDMHLARRPQNILYQDEYQIITMPSDIEIYKTYPLEYAGPRDRFIPYSDTRPNFIRHESGLRDWCRYAFYSGEREFFVSGAALASDLGMVAIGIHHEILSPGKRSSWPHAHSAEEELVYILEGEATVWVNGQTYLARAGEVFFFPPASGLAHTILNDSQSDVVMMVFGEQGRKEDQIFYPHHPRRNLECEQTGRLWKDYPLIVNWSDVALPNDKRTISKTPFAHQLKVSDVAQVEVGSAESTEHVYCLSRDIARALGAKRVALHHMTLPAGKRSSHAHAESAEEEFIYVLSGNPLVWINGHTYELRAGDAVAFPSGTGIAHTLINRSTEAATFIVSGEMTKDHNLCAFPINPELKESCGIWWDDYPRHLMGPDSDLP